MTCILAAAETVTSQSWWTQAVGVIVTIGAVATALWAILRLLVRYVPLVRNWWEARKQARALERAAALEAIVKAATDRIDKRMAAAERLQSVRHTQNLEHGEEANRRLARVELSQRQINERIDRHMDEEREERRADRAELLGYLNLVGVLRREDAQRLRDRRVGDEAPPSS